MSSTSKEREFIVFGGLEYLIKGNPVVLIESGMHGDEREIIPLVWNEIKKRFEALPDFIYLPKASPSAVRMNRRENGDGDDLNRMFTPRTASKEARIIMDAVSSYRCKLHLSFHEDLFTPNFYLYDSLPLEGTDFLESLRNQVLACGVGLYNGIDAPDDPSLGFVVKNGFCHYQPNGKAGFFGDWTFSSGVTKRMVEIEIPALVSKEQQRKLVQIVFEKYLYDFK